MRESIAAIALAPKIGPYQRRKQVRYRVHRPGVLRNPDHGLIAIRVLEVSWSGLRVSLPCRLPLHAPVEVEFDGAVLSGVVRHCQCIAAEVFHVGIWLPTCDPADPATIHPTHRRALAGGVVLP